MNELHIDLPKEAYTPGEILRGTLRWNLANEPAFLELALFWYTEGKGTTDSGAVDRQTIDQPGRQGSREFTFVLPAGPVSFNGTLISLIWGVEVIAGKGKISQHASFVLSPNGKPLDLQALQPEASEDEAKAPRWMRRHNAG